MPEGDTLLRTAETLHRALAGQAVTRFETQYAQLANVDHDTPLAGQKVEWVRAHGKHLLMRFSGGLTLRTHMRMNGSWHIYRVGEPWRRAKFRMRVLVQTPEYVAVGFDVPVAELLNESQLERHDELRALGPDLLAESFDVEEAIRRFTADKTREVADVLLDQQVIAGAGNIYKCEALFAQGIHPFDPVAALDLDAVRALIMRAREMMRAKVGSAPGAGANEPSAHLWVYGRGGESCRKCGTRIGYRKQGVHARGTYFCPNCQPARVAWGA
jgi:endonuclease VIII